MAQSKKKNVFVSKEVANALKFLVYTDLKFSDCRGKENEKGHEGGLLV